MGQTASQRIGLITGLVLAVLLQFIPVPDGLSREAWLLGKGMIF